MPLSMTGFGSARGAGPLGVTTIEIRSVNNRFLDAQIRGLGQWREWESRARALCQGKINRGKVEVSVSWEPAPDIRPRLAIREDVLTDLLDSAQPLAERLGLSAAALVGPASAITGAIERQTPDVDKDELFAEWDATLAEALGRLREERAREGQALADDMLARGGRLRELRSQIEQNQDAVVVKYRERLTVMAAKLSEGAKAALDGGRLEAEIALFADRCDISEELSRLGVHLDELEAKLRSDDGEPVGKALDFLVQEILRETNTIGSKGRDTDVARAVLEMKNEIEKIREQVQNLE